MALAIKFQEMVDCGEVRDYADLARLGYVTRARMTQIMNMLLLAPEIQAQLLGLGRNSPDIPERITRATVNMPFWPDQIAQIKPNLRNSASLE
jgi:hypothetical protein